MGYPQIFIQKLIRPRFLISSVFLFCLVVVVIYSCQRSNKQESELFYLNHHDSVKYVGMATCASCHEDKAKTFIHTGMGSSFYLATPEKSAADFSKNSVIYDTINDFYYKAYWVKNEMFMMEFRIENKDTVHKRVEKIDYIIGSGQHTNSHLIVRNGFVYQAPMTWYSQKKHWGLPPGFENGKNSRFKRLIDAECMSCHNAMPQLEANTDNKFVKVGLGIDCERCHGPGELHVKMRLKGRGPSHRDSIDRTIVNPAKLDWPLQIDLCQRCHLQGNALLKEGKTFTAFKPGMKLSDFMEVFMPKFPENSSSFIMASHAQRLQQSQCFIKSNRFGNAQNLTCINCHNPHISVKETDASQYNNACKNCHSKEKECKTPLQVQAAEEYNCVKCHMPKSGATDIPHVQIHDHKIQVASKMRPVSNEGIAGLYCVNSQNTSSETLIKAYLSYYEKFSPDALYLKKAREILDKRLRPDLEVYYWFLKNNFAKAAVFGSKLDLAHMDAWTCYRMGQSLMNQSKWKSAEKYIEQACRLQPKNFEFLFKRSVVEHELKNSIAEELSLKSVLELNSNHTQALNNLGYFYFKKGEIAKSGRLYERCLVTNPDYVPLLKNLFDYYLFTNNLSKAKGMAQKILKLEPDNKALLSFLKPSA